MYSVILENAPETWDRKYTKTSTQITLDRYDEEYRQILFEANQAMSSTFHDLNIQRNQNIHDLGQMLIKEQKTLVEGTSDLYKGRRFIKINRNYLDKALKYNLDHRRCGLNNLCFKKRVNKIDSTEVLIAVQCLLHSKNEDNIQPEYSDEYYIDYIITL